MSTWTVYLLRRADGALYTGVTTDVERRLGEHEAGRGAKALRGKGPLEVVFQREVEDRSAALRAEARIKRLSRTQKEELVRGSRPFDVLAEPG